MAGEKTIQKKKNFSRRDFVIGSGTVLASGALSTFTPDAAGAMTAAEAPKNPY